MNLFFLMIFSYNIYLFEPFGGGVSFAARRLNHDTSPRLGTCLQCLGLDIFNVTAYHGLDILNVTATHFIWLFYPSS